MDVVGAAVALVFSMPLQMVVAVTIKVDSRLFAVEGVAGAGAAVPG